MKDAPETPEHEAGVAIGRLEDWAREHSLIIDHFQVAHRATRLDNCAIAVGALTSDGAWLRQACHLNNLSDPADCDAALIRLATHKGWAQLPQRVS